MRAEVRTAILWELARALQHDAGRSGWSQLRRRSQDRWYQRAVELVGRCPTLRGLVLT